MYRPLPKQLTIKNSVIEGLGLFAGEEITANYNLYTYPKTGVGLQMI